MKSIIDEYFIEFRFVDARKKLKKAVEALVDMPMHNASASGMEPEDPEGEDPEEDSITYFEAIAQIADEINKNNRIYPRDVLEAALTALQPRIAAKEVFAMSDHPSMYEGPRIGRIAAIVTDARLNNAGQVVIAGSFIDNDASKEVKSLLKAGVKVGISARGYGDFHLDEKTGVQTFKAGYEIEGWDFVVYPAARAAVTHYESVEVPTNKPDISKEETKMSEELKTVDPIRTADGLRAAYPELVAQLEKTLSDKIAELEAQIADSLTKIAALVDEKSQLQVKFDELTATNTVVVTGLDDAMAKLAIADAEITKIKTDIAAAELKIATDLLMKDHKYAKHIVISDSYKTIEEVTAFVEAKTAELDAFAASIVVPVVVDTVIPETPKAKAEDTTRSPLATSMDQAMNIWINLAKKA